MQFTAIILAGGEIENDLARHTGAAAKAFIKINSKYMVEYAIDALRASDKIKEIILVSDLNITPPGVKEKVDKSVQSGKSIMDTLINGIDAAAGSKSVVALPCDMPLVNKDIIEEFAGAIHPSTEFILSEANVLRTGELPLQPQIVYGIVEKQNYVKKFPGLRRTYMKLKDGTFCGTGFFYLDTAAVKKLKEAFAEITKLRKAPWKIITTLGLKIIFKFLTKTLSVKDLEEKAAQIFGCSAKAAVLDSPEAAVNVDGVEDLLAVEGILNRG